MNWSRFLVRETLFDSSFLVLFGCKNRVGRSVKNKKKISKKFFYFVSYQKNMGRSVARNQSFYTLWYGGTDEQLTNNSFTSFLTVFNDPVNNLHDCS